MREELLPPWSVCAPVWRGPLNKVFGVLPTRWVFVGVCGGSVAQNRLQEPMDADVLAVGAVGDHVVRAQSAQGLPEGARVGAEGGEESAGNVVGCQPGHGV